jgi:hypothetical protein
LKIIKDQKQNKKYKNYLEHFYPFGSFADFNHSDQSRKYILNEENFNIDRITENTKRFFFEECIPSVVNSHNENFDKINLIFIEAFKIKLIDKVQEDININIFKEEMKKILNDSYLNFPIDANKFTQNEILNKNRYDSRSINTNFFMKDGYGYGYENQYDNYNENDNNYLMKNEGRKNEFKFCIFFGDEAKIKLIIEIIQEKLKNIYMVKKGQNLENIEKMLYQGKYM